KITILQEYIEKIEAIQQRISKTAVTKYVLDYSGAIADFQNKLSILRQSTGTENEISFFTMEEHSIVTDQEFTKEALLNLASIIDVTFPSEKGNALFFLNCEYGSVELSIFPYENSDQFDKADLEEFATMISNEVFNGDPVFVDIVSTDVEKSGS
ncbi:MAG TPA: hypothetical protein VGP47_06610, partial [Parachlamydiaceae bacterium]|nr:hypothetical protein [Parachlamydiaceae bacterium]